MSNRVLSLGESRVVDGYTMYRLVCSERGVGGWVKGLHNIEGLDAWIGGEAQVLDSAVVKDQARVLDNAKVLGNAQIGDSACVFDSAVVAHRALVYGAAHVHSNAHVVDSAQVFEKAMMADDSFAGGNAKVCGIASIYGSASLTDRAMVSQEARVGGRALVRDDAKVYGYANVAGHAQVCGHANVHGNATITGNATVKGTAEVCQSQLIRYGVLKRTPTKQDLLETSLGVSAIGGRVLLYKRVLKDLSSGYDSSFRYPASGWVEAAKVDNSEASCAPGLHFSTANYKGWEKAEGYVILAAWVNVDDIITIQQGKVRCRKAEIIGVCDP